MVSHKAYETNPYAKELDTTVIRVFQDKGRHCAVLEDSILFPEGGGQPSDRGSIGDAIVLDVIHANGEALHIVDRALEPGPTRVSLDWERRCDHMQQHTGQHLLTAIAQGRFGWTTTAFHLGPELCDIELRASKIPDKQRLELEEAVLAEIIAARPVSASWVTQEQYSRLEVRSRGLPEGHQGDIRLVEIQGIDINTCGGTHVASTSEIESVKLIGTEPISGGIRLFFVFGKRVRARMEAHEHRNHQLRTLLGRPDEDLVSALEQRLAHENELERLLRHTDGELAALYASSLLAQPGALLAHHFESKDASFLQKITRAMLEADASRVAFVTARKDGNAFFSLACGDGCGADIPRLGREVASILGGKGGGSGKHFQGKFTDIGKLEEAKSLLMASIGERNPSTG